jgi:hypothetical protein
MFDTRIENYISWMSFYIERKLCGCSDPVFLGYVRGIVIQNISTGVPLAEGRKTV